MLKTTKNLLLLVSFFSSSIFPMTRVAQALLIRRTLNQTSSFHNSLQTKCPLGSAAFLCMVEEIPKVQENVNTLIVAEVQETLDRKIVPDLKNTKSHQYTCSMSTDHQSKTTPHSYIKMQEQEHSNRYLDSKPNYWKSKLNDTQTLNNNSNAASNHLKLDLAKEVYIATIKSQLYNLAINFTAILKDATKHLSTLCCSLSHHDALAQKEVLVKELTSLKNMLTLAIQKNPNAFEILNKFKYHENPSMMDHTLDALTFKDFIEAFTILRAYTKIPDILKS